MLSNVSRRTGSSLRTTGARSPETVGGVRGGSDASGSASGGTRDGAGGAEVTVGSTAGASGAVLPGVVVSTVPVAVSVGVVEAALSGVTGSKNLDVDEVAGRVAEIRTLTTLPIGVGFGVRDAETAKAVAKIADAVVVGSRMVQAVESSSPENVVANLAALTSELRQAIDSQSF